MPRANRNLIPGHVWHITHRCHKKEFLLKFRRDKLLWMRWLLEAKRRFGLIILNFMITSNHIHLMGMGRDRSQDTRALGTPPVPPVSMAIQLAQARVAQRYNQRKDRHGAFWEDRFHATAIECGTQLAKCLTYVDMNMVRAGVVRHPRDWPFCGYDELLRPDVRPRLKLVDMDALASLVGARDLRSLKSMREEWIEQAIQKRRIEREALWTESVAVGSEEFLMKIRGELGGKVKAAEIVRQGDSLSLYRVRRSYLCNLPPENDENEPQNDPEPPLSC
jgi:putative transposase